MLHFILNPLSKKKSKKEAKTTPYRTSERTSERGNVFFTLFGAVAVVGVLGAGIMQTMRGPLSTMVEVNLRERAKVEMSIASKLVMLQASDAAASGDCDSDGFVEPFGYSANIASLTGGGSLPTGAQTDPWGNEYGYCSWDPGNLSGDAACTGAGTGDYGNLLSGDAPTAASDYSVIAIISAGPDGVFSTSCNNHPTLTTPGGDDLVEEYSYDYATASTGGLWSIKAGTPDSAEIDKDVDLTNAVAALGGASPQLILGGSSVVLPTDATPGLATCNAANVNILRVNTATTPDSLELCAVTAAGPTYGWASVAAGASASSLADDDTTVGVDDGAGTITFTVDGTVEATISSSAFDAGSLNVTTTGTLNAGDATLGNTSVGTLGASGLATLDSLTVTNAATFNGAATFNNAITMDNDLTITGSSNTGSGGSLIVNNSDSSMVFVVQHNGDVDTDGNINIDGRYQIGGNDILMVPNTTSDTNIFVGKDAGNMSITNTNEGNTILGANSAQGVDANNNTVIGANAGTANLGAGDNNILIGQGVDVSIADAANELNIGDAITGNLSNGNVAVTGDLTVTGGDITVNGASANQILVNSAGSFSPTTLAGDATLSGGTMTISDNAVQEDDIDVSSFGAGTGATCLKTDGSSIFTETCSGGGGGDGVGTDGIGDLADVTITSAADANVLIYNSGTGDWENEVVGGDATIANDGTLTIANNAVEEAMLNVANAPTDEYCLSYESGSSNFEWQVCSGLGAIPDDSIDWDKITDTMTLDATTTIDMDTNTADLNFDNNTFVIDSDLNRVGIGTNAPGARLEVLGQGGFTGLTALSFNQDGLIVYGGTNGGTVFARGDATGNDDNLNLEGFTSINFNTFPSGTRTTRMSIRNNGQVGIGTTSPAASSLLDLTSTTQGFLVPRMTQAQRDLISSPATGLLVYNTDTNAHDVYNGSAWVPVSSSATELIDDDSDTSIEVDTAGDGSADTTIFTNDGAETMRITATGQVGIGTAAPVTMLDVNGGVRVGSVSGAAAPTYMALNDLSDTDVASVTDGQILQYNTGSGNWEAATLGASSIPDDSLDWDKFIDAMTLDATTTIDMDTNTANLNFDNNTFFIDSTNNHIGIGTNVPDTGITINNSTYATPTGLNANVTRLLIARQNNNVGLAINAGPTSNAVIQFGDQAQYEAGRISYNNEFNRMAFTTNDNAQAVIDSTGALSIGSALAGADASSILDLTSTTRGFLAPRMDATARDAIDNDTITPGQQAATGLMIYNTDTDSFQFWDGSVWADIGAGAVPPDSIDWDDITDTMTLDAATTVSMEDLTLDFFDNTTDNNSVLFIDGTNDRVGIGTNTPQGPFHVRTTGSGELARFQATDAGSNANIMIYSAEDAFIRYVQNGVQTWHAGLDAGDSGKFKISAGNLTGNEVLTLTTGGAMGLGTTTPDASSLLDLTSTTRGFLAPRMDTTARNGITSPATGLMVYNTDTNVFDFNAGTPGSPNWISFATTSGSSRELADADNDTLVQVEEGGPGADDDIIRFDTAGTERMTINATGAVDIASTGALNVGFGSPPTTGLQVYADTSSDPLIANFRGTANHAGYIRVAGGGTGLGTSGGLEIRRNSSVNSAEGFFVMSNGNWIHGPDVGDAGLHILSDREGTAPYEPMMLWTGGAERLRIDTSGGVGIGTVAAADASALLDLTSTDRGLLPPRMTTAQRNAINSGTFATGLMIYNDSDDEMQFWDGAAWVSMNAGSATVAPDSIDWDDITDTMTLDATTTIDMDTNTADLNFDSNTLVINSATNTVSIGGTGTSRTLNVTGSAVISDILKLGAGTDAGPALSRTGASTGIYFPDVSTMGVASGGSEFVRFDGANTRVGIGTDAPQGTLDVSDIQYDVGTGSCPAGYEEGDFDGEADAADCRLIGLVVDNTTGQVGIGTAAPTAELEIIPNGVTNGGIVIGTGFESNPTNARGGIGFRRESGSQIEGQIYASGTGGGLNMNYDTRNGHFFFSNGTQTMGIAEVGNVIIGQGGGSFAVDSAVLELRDSTRGFLPPRMTTAERNAINSGTFATGLMVYNESDDEMQFWDGAAWVSMNAGSATVAPDSLDWDDFTDTMTLDATTTIDMDTNTADLNFDANTFVIDSDTNRVGIGINAPSEALHIAGAASKIRIENTSGVTRNYNIGTETDGNLYIRDVGLGQTLIQTTINGGTSGLSLVPEGLNVGVGTIQPQGKFDVSDLQFDVGTGSCPAGYTEGDFDGEADLADCRLIGLVVDNTTGQVGIGTTAPAASLHVQGDVTGTYDSLILDNDATAATNNRVSMIFQGNRTGDVDTEMARITATMTDSSAGGSDSDLSFLTNDENVSAERMRITSTGNIGVGISAPDASALLHLNSTTRGFLPPRMTTTQRTTDMNTRYGAANIADGLMVYDTDLEQVFIYDQDSTSWQQIATTTSLATDRITDGDGDTYVDVDNADDDNIRFFIGDASGSGIGEAMTIDENGRVGIKDNAPTYLLDVGDTGATGDLFRVKAGTADAFRVRNNGVRIDYGFGLSVAGSVNASTFNRRSINVVPELSGAWTAGYTGMEVVPTNGGSLSFTSNPIGLNVDMSNITGSIAGIFQGGNVGIGTDQPQGTLDVSDIQYDVGTGSCPAGYTEGDFDGDADAADCRLIGLVVDNTTGRVGIGTAAPSSALHINNDNLGEHLIIERGANIYEFTVSGARALWQGISNINTYNIADQDDDANFGFMDNSPDAHFEISADATTGGAAFMISSDHAADGDLFTVLESGSVGIGTASPDASAQLDITSTARGFLPPRMTTAQRNAINSGTFATGLMIYNTSDDQMEFWDGAAWIPMQAGSVTIPADSIDWDDITDTMTLDAATTVSMEDLTLNFFDNTTDNNSVLFIDGTNDRVGIGNNAPATALDVVGVVTANNNGVNNVPYFVANNTSYAGRPLELKSISNTPFTGNHQGLRVGNGGFTVSDGDMASVYATNGSRIYGGLGGSSDYIEVDSVFNNVGTVLSINATNAISSAANGDHTLFALNNDINHTGVGNINYRGIYYNPTITALQSGDTHRAIETVTGDVIFGSTSGRVGIGTLEPQGTLDVSDLQFDIGTGSCPAGYEEGDFDGEADAADCRLIGLVVDNTTGRVGIGNATPTATLHVIGQDGQGIEVEVNNGNPAIWLNRTGTNSGAARIRSSNLGRLDLSSDDDIQLLPTGGVGIGALSTDASALLEITSTTRGFLGPRMDTTARDAIDGDTITPGNQVATGLMIYNTSTNRYQFFDGATWTDIGAGTPSGGVDTIADADSDTRVEVDNSDDDNIRFFIGDASGSGIGEAMRITQTGDIDTLNDIMFGPRVDNNVAPGIFFTGENNGSQVVFRTGGAGERGVFNHVSGFTAGANSAFSFTNINNASTGTADTQLIRSDAGVMAQRLTTPTSPAQEFRIYSTSDGTDDEFASMGWLNNANVFGIQTEAIGAGTVRDIALLGGNVGIGTNLPQGTLDVSDLQFDVGTTGSCPAGYTEGDFDGEADDVDCRLIGMVVDNTTGRVGIGTAAPTTGLHVESDIYIRDKIDIRNVADSRTGFVQMGSNILRLGIGGTTFIGASAATTGVAIGNGVTTPDASAQLDVQSTTRGFLPPRMTTAQRNAINSGTFATGLMIYNTSDDQMEFWDGAAWIPMQAGSVTIPADSIDWDDIADNMVLDAATTSSMENLTLNFVDNTTDNNSVLFIDGTNDRIGIGTSAPGAPLEIQNANPDLLLNFSGSPTDTRASIVFADNGTTYSSISAERNGSQGLILELDADSDASGYLGVNVNSTEALRITDSRQVGIGDSTPDLTLLLDVEGQVGATEYCDENGANCFDHTNVLGSTTPGGADTQVQFNNSGVLDGDAGMTFSASTDTLTVGTAVEVGDYINIAGQAGSAPSFAALNDLSNVNTSPSDGDVLTYNNTSGNWEAVATASSSVWTDNTTYISYGLPLSDGPNEGGIIILKNGETLNSAGLDGGNYELKGMLFDTDKNSFLIGASQYSTYPWDSIGNSIFAFGNASVSGNQSAFFNLTTGSIGVYSESNAFRVLTNNADVEIGTSSAAMNITSTTAGFLTPRMTTAQRDGITTPATGLMVYNTSTNTFDFYNGSAWTTIGGSPGASNEVIDADSDTWVRTETDADADNDTLRFAAGGSVEHMRITSAGNVGIGNTTPSSALDVTGDIEVSNYLKFNGVAGDAPTYITQSGLDWDDFVDAMTLDATTTIDMTAGDLNFDSNTFVIDSSADRIGIGTATPDFALTVRNDSGTADNPVAAFWGGGTANDESYIRVGTGILNNTILGHNNGAGGPGRYGFLTASGSGIGTKALVWKDDGTVGINTTTTDASAILDINSTTKGFLGPRMTEAQRDLISSPATGLMVYNTDDDTFDYWNGASWTSIGSGLGGASDRIEDTGNQDTYIDVDTDGADGDNRIDFHTAGSERMRITNGGNVGIGTTTPANELDVSGDVRSNSLILNGVAGNTPTYVAPTLALNDISNVSAASPSSNDVLTWNGSSWVAQAGGGGSAIDWANIVNAMTLDATTTIDMDTNTANLNFDSNTFVIDSANNRIGIGTATPGQTLDLQGSYTLVSPLGEFTSRYSGRAHTARSIDSTRIPLTVAAHGGQTADIFVVTDSSFTSNLFVVDNDGQIGIGTSDPDASAALDITSTTQGFLGPRMTTTDRNNISTPATGLMIYNTSTDTMDYYNGSAWTSFSTGAASSTEVIDADSDTWIRTETNANADNDTLRFAAGGSTEHMRITSAGNVGIGNATPNVALDVTGDIEYSGVITDVSDRRLKTDITPLSADDMISRLSQIDTYTFRMIDDEDGKLEYGVMAQEIEKIFPELVKTADDEMGTKSVNYVGLIAPMIEATKSLKDENEALRDELAEVKAGQDDIMATLASMQDDINGMKAHTGFGIEKASLQTIGMMLLMMIFGGACVMITTRIQRHKS